MLTSIAPTLPLAPYIGGKSRLAATLIQRIAAIPHETYCEPFVGMGGVFLRRPYRAKGEIINDASGDLINFFRVVQRHHQAFLDALHFQLTSRTDFERLMATPPDVLTDIERAARFFYLQKTCFGGKPVGRTYGTAKARPASFNAFKVRQHIERVYERLASVTVECLPYQECITRYDSPGTLFYLDPPYFGSENYYGRGMFPRENFEALASQLRGIAGKFIVSINDHPEIRRLFDGFQMAAVEVNYTVAGGDKQGKFGELIISGG